MLAQHQSSLRALEPIVEDNRADLVSCCECDDADTAERAVDEVTQALLSGAALGVAAHDVLDRIGPPPTVAAVLVRLWQWFAAASDTLLTKNERVAATRAVDEWFATTVASVASATSTRRTTTAAIARSALVANLLDGRVPSRIAGWDADAPHRVVVFAGAPAALIELIAGMEGSVVGTLGGIRNLDPCPHAVVVVCEPPPHLERVVDALARGHDAVGIISATGVPASRVRDEYVGLSSLLRLCEASGPGVVPASRLAVLRVVEAIDSRVVADVLEPIVGSIRRLRATAEGADLVRTAELVSERGSIVAAGAAMGVDRRTVTRRLRRFERHVGAGVGDRDERLLIQLALHVAASPPTTRA